MNINRNILQATLARSKAVDIPDKLDWTARPLRRRDGSVDFAKFRQRAGWLGFDGSRTSGVELERILGDNDLVDEFYLEKALLAARPVARIVLRTASGKQRGFATGFMVAPRIMMTNWHVFEQKSDAVNAVAEFNYKLDLKGNAMVPSRYMVRSDLYFHADAQLDYALVALDEAALETSQPLSSFGYLRLLAEPGKINPKEWVTIIQHPSGQPKQIAIRENQLLEPIQPKHLWYKADTAKGSSGSPVFNDSFQLVALHHSGVPKKEGGKFVLVDGSKVDSLTNVLESDVVWIANEGVRVSALCAAILANAPKDSPYFNELKAAMNDSGDVMSSAGPAGEMAATTVGRGAGHSGVGAIQAVDGGIFIPLTLKLGLSDGVGLGAASPPRVPRVAAAPVAVDRVDPVAAVLVEKAVEPIIDSNYDNREGYDDNFLGVRVPMPVVSAKALKVCATLPDGGIHIPYCHFSVVLVAPRRLALFTASNVDFSKAMRAAGSGRDKLGGLSDKDTEKWVTDARVPDNCQIPDVFYNKDRQAFDKGHLVRRDDVCWGKSFETIQRANGDTFHTTNCSPQVADFNRDVGAFDGIWGMLENSIGRQGKVEKYCIFSGPVFAADDPEFHGVDDRGAVTLKIPQRYWKVVVVKSGQSLQAFAFVLEQDLSHVKMTAEFTVDTTFQSSLVSLKKLEQVLNRSITFPDALHKGDQFGKSAGNTLVESFQGDLGRYGSTAAP